MELTKVKIYLKDLDIDVIRLGISVPIYYMEEGVEKEFFYVTYEDECIVGYNDLNKEDTEVEIERCYIYSYMLEAFSVLDWIQEKEIEQRRYMNRWPSAIENPEPDPLHELKIILQAAK